MASNATPASLTLRGLVKDFGATRVLHGIDLQVAAGEFVVLVGPSGCGKSTLLRLICGLEEASAGDIEIGGQRVNHLRAADRGLAMVFQSYALYPHMSVYQNLAFGLQNIGMAKGEIDAKVNDAARLLRLDALLQRKPTQLSGGQRQRVAIGRAIVREPGIFLFDEPLSNLDAELRVAMRSEISALHRRLSATMIYVTHDQTEAMTMADKIVVLRAGRAEQIGSPLELYNRPANRFVAGFIGSPQMNFFAAEARGGSRIVLSAVGDAAAPTFDMPGLTLAAGRQVTLGVRPEHLSLDARPGALPLPMVVTGVEQLGAQSVLYGHLRRAGEPTHGNAADTPLVADDATLAAATQGTAAATIGDRITVICPGQVGIRVGDSLTVHAPAESCHLFERATVEGGSENAIRT